MGSPLPLCRRRHPTSKQHFLVHHGVGADIEPKASSVGLMVWGGTPLERLMSRRNAQVKRTKRNVQALTRGSLLATPQQRLIPDNQSIRNAQIIASSTRRQKWDFNR